MALTKLLLAWGFDQPRPTNFACFPCPNFFQRQTTLHLPGACGTLIAPGMFPGQNQNVFGVSWAQPQEKTAQTAAKTILARGLKPFQKYESFGIVFPKRSWEKSN